MIKLAIFASGSGSNALKLISFFKNHPQISVNYVYVNNPKAGIIEKLAGDERLVVGGRSFFENDLTQKLQEAEIDGIVLAGFLWLLPAEMIVAFENRILNIHPALLPAYGGKGMYGENVHKAVLANNESKTGITIHLANEVYDQGKILLQRSVQLSALDTLETVKQKIQRLEHRYFASTVEHYFYHQAPLRKWA